MKRLLLVLILTFSFQTLTKANDISDFEIEGMSIGDSALDYFSKKDIEKNSRNYFKDKTYTPVQTKDYPFFKIYDGVDFSFKTTDKKFIIVRMSGAIHYHEKVKECLIKQIQIVDEISLMLKKRKPKIYDNPFIGDLTGKSRHHQAIFWFDSGDAIDVSCYDYFDKDSNLDHLAVRVVRKEYVDFLNSNPYD
jgi:hypothetical protein